MHKTNCMQSIENISIWEVFSSICPKQRLCSILLLSRHAQTENNQVFVNEVS